MYYYTSGDVEETEEDEPADVEVETPADSNVAQLLKEAGLDEVKKAGGVLDARYAMDLINFIAKEGKRATTTDSYLSKRRELYKAADWEAYKALVASNLEQNQLKTD